MSDAAGEYPYLSYVPGPPYKPPRPEDRRTEPHETPELATARVLLCLGRINNARRGTVWRGRYDRSARGWAGPIPELLHAIALDEMTPGFERPIAPYCSEAFDGPLGPLLAAVPEYHAARALGLGSARIPAGREVRVRASAAEVLADLWGEVALAASNAGVGRAFNAALMALSPPMAFPIWGGMDPDRFALWTYAAISGSADGMSKAHATAATRLAMNGGWKDALYRIDRAGLADGLATAFRMDLDALRAELRLEQVAAGRLRPAGGERSYTEPIVNTAVVERGNKGAGSGPPSMAAPGVAAVDPDGPISAPAGSGLTDRQLAILDELLKLGATTREARKTTAEVARAVDGPRAKANGFKVPVAELGHGGWVDSASGGNGGIWLTPKGVELAERRRAAREGGAPSPEGAPPSLH